MNGIILVNKGRGFTSHDVVAVLRGILGMKKIGHTGTLDPEAEGVLPVCLGFATKICDALLMQPKEYIATGVLGITTDTQDIHGTVTRECEAHVTSEAFAEALAKFHGPIEQLTPMYSARKINGVKLMDLARKGQTIERSTKTVNIYETEILEFDEEKQTYKIRVKCQKGTYIRTICNDLGEALGCGSCMTSLVRTMSGGFELKNALTIDQIRQLTNRGEIGRYIVPIDAMYRTCRPVRIATEHIKYLANGNPLQRDWLLDCSEPLAECPYSYDVCGDEAGKSVRVYVDEDFFAIYKKRGSRYVPLTMYHEVDNEKNHLARCCVSVGKFDGLHTGHQKLLEKMRATGLPAVLLCVVPPNTQELLTPTECSEVAKRFGVARTERLELTEEFRNLSPEEFVGGVLRDRFHAAQIVVGENFRFAKDRTGDVGKLRELAAAHHIECTVLPLHTSGDEAVSSTRIKSLLSEGNIPEVNRLLGFPFPVIGEIVTGKQLGRTMNFPTINQIPPQGKCLPPFGVYRSRTVLRGREYASVTNIGDNPTVKDGIEHAVTVETHIPGINTDVYGETAIVTLYEKLRDQRTFGSLDELSEQLAKDTVKALAAPQQESIFARNCADCTGKA
ncbi:MAG: tRNA pseudouridine(55) synthase TruB [Lachnospiraceae bacterium]|nr:tRNA pseudouridine(55) synthase TruB [Lachnospiraceae bacterium]